MGGEPRGAARDAGGQPSGLRAGAAGRGPAGAVQHRRGRPAGPAAAQRSAHAHYADQRPYAAEATWLV